MPQYTLASPIPALTTPTGIPSEGVSTSGSRMMWRDSANVVHILAAFGGFTTGGWFAVYVNTDTNESLFLTGPANGSFGGAVFNPHNEKVYIPTSYAVGATLTEFNPATGAVRHLKEGLLSRCWYKLICGDDGRMYWPGLDNHLWSYDPVADTWFDYGIPFGFANDTSSNCLCADSTHVYFGAQGSTYPISGPAVDKGGGLVGIPVANHGYAAGANITIYSTVNYNGTHLLDASTSANEIVITASYVAENFVHGSWPWPRANLTEQVLHIAEIGVAGFTKWEFGGQGDTVLSINIAMVNTGYLDNRYVLNRRDRNGINTLYRLSGGNYTFIPVGDPNPDYWWNSTSVVMPNTPRANPTVITINAHGVVDGSYVSFEGLAGGWSAFNGVRQITYIDENSFSVAVDSTGYSGDYVYAFPATCRRYTGIATAGTDASGQRWAGYNYAASDEATYPLLLSYYGWSIDVENLFPIKTVFENTRLGYRLGGSGDFTYVDYVFTGPWVAQPIEWAVSLSNSLASMLFITTGYGAFLNYDYMLPLSTYKGMQCFGPYTILPLSDGKMMSCGYSYKAFLYDPAQEVTLTTANQSPKLPTDPTKPNPYFIVKGIEQGQIHYMYCMAEDKNGLVWIGCNSTRSPSPPGENFGNVMWYDPVTGDSDFVFDSWYLISGTSGQVRDICSANNGAIILVSDGEGHIWPIDADTKTIGAAINVTGSAWMIEVGTDEVIAVLCDITPAKICKIKPSTGEFLIAEQSFNGASGDPFGFSTGQYNRMRRKLVLGPDGYVWMFVGNSLYRINPNTLVFTLVANTTHAKMAFGRGGRDLILFSFDAETGVKYYPNIFSRIDSRIVCGVRQRKVSNAFVRRVNNVLQ